MFCCPLFSMCKRSRGEINLHEDTLGTSLSEVDSDVIVSCVSYRQLSTLSQRRKKQWVYIVYQPVYRIWSLNYHPSMEIVLFLRFLLKWKEMTMSSRIGEALICSKPNTLRDSLFLPNLRADNSLELERLVNRRSWTTRCSQHMLFVSSKDVRL